MKRILKFFHTKYKSVISKTKSELIKLLFNANFKDQDIYFMTSSPRSGSTMLSNALKTIPNSCVLFEPLHINHVPEAKAAGYNWRTYIHPKKEWVEGKVFLKKVFSGKVINGWIAKEMSFRQALEAKKLIVKSVRATRLLPWICNNFDIHKPIILLRHPCAVIASQLKSSDWNNAKRPNADELLKDFPFLKSILVETKTVEEHLAASWALDQIPILMHSESHNAIIVTYEELVLSPNKTLSRIFNSWNLNVDIDAAMRKMKKPSSVVHKSGISGINGWKKYLSSQQIDNILNTVNKFGIDFYDENIEPNYKLLYSNKHSSKLIKMGRS